MMLKPFSVLLPCHDPCPEMLRSALRSVHLQLRGDPRHQVLVFDDCSEDPAVCESAAREWGVELVRPDRELGGIDTHNAAYSLAENELIHVLHPDDWVLPGFYQAVSEAAQRRPDYALYATGSVHVSHDGGPISTTREGWLVEGAFPPLHEGNPVCVPGCVVRRGFLEQHGKGWDRRLKHTADWEFWIRCWKLGRRVGRIGGACEIPWPLAVWRAHPANHSSRLARSGRNLLDYLRLAEVVREYAPELVDDEKLRAYVALRARNQAAAYHAGGDLVAAAENERLARQLESGHVPAFHHDEALPASPDHGGDRLRRGGVGLAEGHPGVQAGDRAHVPDVVRDPGATEESGLPETDRGADQGDGSLTPRQFRIYLASPHYGAIDPAAMPSIMQSSERCSVHVRGRGSSLLAYGFNQLYCGALNARVAEGYTHFAMHHSDIEADPGWLDVLLDEMDRVCADVISAVVAIKDHRGLTSTGWRDRDTLAITRFTMREVMEFPETFDAALAGKPGQHLMVNTGLWVMKLDPAWCERLYFEIRDTIVQLDDGTFQARVLPEDWNASGFFGSCGLKVFATRKVRAVHHGKMGYPNDRVWGEWPVDVGDSPS